MQIDKLVPRPTGEMLDAAVQWFMEREGEQLQLRDLIREAYMVMETIRRKRIIMDATKDIAGNA